MLSKLYERAKTALAPLASELGAVPANEGMAAGWVGVFALAVVMGVGALAPACAIDPVNCHGCWLTYDGDCAVYRCDDNDDLCPTYPPIAKFRTYARTVSGWELYCEDAQYVCSASCNANCGSCY